MKKLNRNDLMNLNPGDKFIIKKFLYGDSYINEVQKIGKSKSNCIVIYYTYAVGSIQRHDKITINKSINKRGEKTTYSSGFQSKQSYYLIE